MAEHMGVAPYNSDTVAEQFHDIDGGEPRTIRFGDLPEGRYVWTPESSILVGPFPDAEERTEYLRGTGAYKGEWTFQVTPDIGGDLRPNNFFPLGPRT